MGFACAAASRCFDAGVSTLTKSSGGAASPSLRTARNAYHPSAPALARCSHLAHIAKRDDPKMTFLCRNTGIREDLFACFPDHALHLELGTLSPKWVRSTQHAKALSPSRASACLARPPALRASSWLQGTSPHFLLVEACRTLLSTRVRIAASRRCETVRESSLSEGPAARTCRSRR